MRQVSFPKCASFPYSPSVHCLAHLPKHTLARTRVESVVDTAAHTIDRNIIIKWIIAKLVMRRLYLYHLLKLYRQKFIKRFAINAVASHEYSFCLFVSASFMQQCVSAFTLARSSSSVSDYKCAPRQYQP